MNDTVEEFKDLLGKTLTRVELSTSSDEIRFFTTDGGEYLFYHRQDCCESVTIEDVVGNWDDLIGNPLTLAESISSNNPNALESGTWTYYKFATVKGYVDVRWYGESNGYYSEEVNFKVVKEASDFRPWTLWKDAGKIMGRNPELRLGQSLFSALLMVRPDLANNIRSGTIDPFNDDKNIPKFMEYLEENT